MAKPKKVNFQLIEREKSKGETAEPYLLLDEIRSEHHFDVHDARIALAWRVREKPDPDGHLVLGRCVKISDLHKELADWDFVIVLNKEVWESFEFTREKKLALLDHEMCHAAPAEDEDGCKKIDERGRTVFRLRKHDIEEFQAIVHRHGCYKRDLERFAETILASRRAPLWNRPNSDAGENQPSTN